jgi:hypothetical protein
MEASIFAKLMPNALQHVISPLTSIGRGIYGQPKSMQEFSATPFSNLMISGNLPKESG